MALKISKRVEDGIGILTLEGTLTLGPTLYSLRTAAHEVVSAPELFGIILDLQKITNVDSSGLSELMVIYTDTGKQHRPMRLVGMNPSVRKLLKIMQLDAVLPSVDELTTAKKEMRKAAGA